MKQLKPMPLRLEYESLIEKKIVQFFREFIYWPINAFIQELPIQDAKLNSVLKNATTGFLAYILEGRIQYSQGRFTGSFNALMSKELKQMGAVFSSKYGAWLIPEGKLPLDIRQMVAQASGKFKKLHDDIIGYIDKMDIDKTVDQLTFADDYTKVITGMDKDYKEIARAVSVPPELSEQTIISLSEEYSNNMKLYIKDWAKDHILQLREKVYYNTFSGGRASNLVDIITDQYGVSKSKAKFLARQETGLLTGKFTKMRYEDLGVKRWKWSATMDNRTRPLHREWHGQIFEINNPPKNEKGVPVYPREDFGCRCRMIPLLD
jgi:SPP1 gp7 family putative phage head morphogenesis protein